VLGLLVGTAGRAEASVTTFFGQDLQPNPNNPVVLTVRPNADGASSQFQAQLSGVTTETFESFATNTPAPLTLHFGPDTATLTGAGTVVLNTSIGISVGRFAISGTQYVETTQGFNVSFSSPQAAFGFCATDVGDIGGQLVLTLANGAHQTFTVPGATGNNANGSVLFFGLIGSAAADQFTAVSFSNTNPNNDFFGFDNMTIGRLSQVTAAPEPSTLISGGMGVLMCLAYGWRRRTAKAAA
jgi:hypothetical protein